MSSEPIEVTVTTPSVAAPEESEEIEQTESSASTTSLSASLEAIEKKRDEVKRQRYVLVRREVQRLRDAYYELRGHMEQHPTYVRRLLIPPWYHLLESDRLQHFMIDKHRCGTWVHRYGKIQEEHEWSCVITLNDVQLSYSLIRWSNDKDWHVEQHYTNSKVVHMPYDDETLQCVARGNWMPYWHLALRVNKDDVLRAMMSLCIYCHIHWGGKPPSCLMKRTA